MQRTVWFSFLPTFASAELVKVTISAKDEHGASVSQTYEIAIDGVASRSSGGLGAGTSEAGGVDGGHETLRADVSAARDGDSPGCECGGARGARSSARWIGCFGMLLAA